MTNILWSYMGLYLVGSSYKDPGQIKLAWKRPLFEDNSEFDAKEVILILSWIRTIERIWYFHFMLMIRDRHVQNRSFSTMIIPACKLLVLGSLTCSFRKSLRKKFLTPGHVTKIEFWSKFLENWHFECLRSVPQAYWYQNMILHVIPYRLM